MSYRTYQAPLHLTDNSLPSPLVAWQPPAKSEPLVLPTASNASTPAPTLWLSSLCLVLVVYVAPLTWLLWPGATQAPIQQPASAMLIELEPLFEAPIDMAKPMPSLEPKEPLPTLPETTETPPPAKTTEMAPLTIPTPAVPAIPQAVLPEAHQPPSDAAIPPEQDIVPDIVQSDSSTLAEPPATTDIYTPASQPSTQQPQSAVNTELNWQTSLLLQLNNAKRYPAQARRFRHEGIAYLRFRIDRSGKLMYASIALSSGHSALDEETLALIKRAQPLPAPPADMPDDALEFVVPVEFFLNKQAG